MSKFLSGFLLGALAFLTANLLAAHFMSDCGLPAVFGVDSCADDIIRAGWPFQFYEEGGIAFHSYFDGLKLAIDIAAGLILASGTGWWLKNKRPDKKI